MKHAHIIARKIAFVFFVIAVIAVKSQTTTETPGIEETRLNKFAVGFNLNQYQHDFGVGMNITSPYIKKSIAFRLMGSAQWLQNIPKGDTATTWSPYVNFRLSVVTRQFVITDKISVYTEGGIVLLVPNKEFSSHATQFGGFGVFGFEFHPSAHWAPFIEAGGIGTGAIADKSVGRPIYSNGFVVSTGFRIYF